MVEERIRFLSEILSVVFIQICQIILLCMMILITYDVIARYIFNRPLAWSVEVSSMMFVGIVFLGLGYATLTKRHVRIEFFTQKLNPSNQKWVRLIVDLLAILILSIFVWRAFYLVIRSYQSGARSEESILFIPLYIPQIIIPLGLSIFLLQLIIQFIDQLKDLKK